MTQPARGYSWPPFERGNRAAERHGAYSPRRVDPLATELVQEVADGLEWLTTADRPAVWAWARAEAQAQLLSEWLAAAAETAGDGVGDLADERVRSAYLLLHRAETRAANLRRQLGLTPLSRARLGRDVAAGQASAAQAMAAEARRMAEEADRG